MLWNGEETSVVARRRIWVQTGRGWPAWPVPGQSVANPMCCTENGLRDVQGTGPAGQRIAEGEHSVPRGSRRRLTWEMMPQPDARRLGGRERCWSKEPIRLQSERIEKQRQGLEAMDAPVPVLQPTAGQRTARLG